MLFTHGILAGVKQAFRNPVAFHLTASQLHVLEGADTLLDQIEADALLADKAYDADERGLNQLEAKIVLPLFLVRIIANNNAHMIEYGIKHVIL